MTLLLVSFQGFFVSVFYCFLNSEVSTRGWGFLWHSSLQADKFSTRLYCFTGLEGWLSLIPHLKVFGDQSWCYTCSPRFCPDRNGCCVLLWRRKIHPQEQMLSGCTCVIWCSRDKGAPHPREILPQSEPINMQIAQG